MKCFNQPRLIGDNLIMTLEIYVNRDMLDFNNVTVKIWAHRDMVCN